MKRLVGTLVLLVLAGVTTTARAAECRVNGGAWGINQGGQVGLEVLVDVKLLEDKTRILLSGAKLECQFSPSGNPNSKFEDYWLTAFPTWVAGPKFVKQVNGLKINDAYYDMPMKRVILVATMPDNAGPVKINVTPYILLRADPNNPIDVKKGDVLGALYLTQTNNGDGLGSSLKLTYKANNDFSISPSTCTINNNNPIEIDFGTVHQRAIGTDPSTTTIRSDRRLTYSCPDGGITTPITITYKGIPSTFDKHLLVMTNPDVGTAMLRNGAAVQVGGSFLTNINNSTGGDDVTFALVRRAGSLPTTGAVTGSGVLVMGVP